GSPLHLASWGGARRSNKMAPAPSGGAGLSIARRMRSQSARSGGTVVRAGGLTVRGLCRERAQLGPVDGGEDGLGEFRWPSELRPVAGGEVDVLNVAHAGQLRDVRDALRNPIAELLAGDFARDDRAGHVVPPLVVEHLH